jgi:hypothetical protein
MLYANQTIQSDVEKIITRKERFWHTMVRDTIKAGQDSGECRSDIDAERLALLFNRSARAVFLDWCISDAGFDLVKEGVGFMGDWIMAALRNPSIQS